MTEYLDRWGFPVREIRLKQETPAPKPPPKPKRPPLDDQILPVLRQLCAEMQTHRRPLASREIARRCGCDHETILKTERRAKRKMRAILGADYSQLFSIFRSE